MSLLQTIKSLFCKKTPSEPEASNSTAEKASEKKSCCHSHSSDEKADSETKTSSCHNTSDATPTPEVKAEPQPTPAPKPTQTKPSKPKPAVQKTVIAPNPAKCNAIPEDVTLKRHFMATIKAQVENSLPPCPSDSALKRHHAAQVQAEIERLTQS
jgi:hypothetical protein